MVRLLDGSSGGGSVATILEMGYNYVPVCDVLGVKGFQDLVLGF